MEHDHESKQHTQCSLHPTPKIRAHDDQYGKRRGLYAKANGHWKPDLPHPLPREDRDPLASVLSHDLAIAVGMTKNLMRQTRGRAPMSMPDQDALLTASQTIPAGDQPEEQIEILSRPQECTFTESPERSAWLRF